MASTASAAVSWHCRALCEPANVTILDLKYRESGYDTDCAGSFSSSDAFLDTLWGKAARTMYVNVRDN